MTTAAKIELPCFLIVTLVVMVCYGSSRYINMAPSQSIELPKGNRKKECFFSGMRGGGKGLATKKILFFEALFKLFLD